MGSVGSQAWWRCQTPDADCTSTTRCRVSLLARRFAPAVCLGLDDGAHLLAPIADTDHPGVLHLAADGSVDELAA